MIAAVAIADIPVRIEAEPGYLDWGDVLQGFRGSRAAVGRGCERAAGCGRECGFLAFQSRAARRATLALAVCGEVFTVAAKDSRD